MSIEKILEGKLNEILSSKVKEERLTKIEDLEHQMKEIIDRKKKSSKANMKGLAIFIFKYLQNAKAQEINDMMHSIIMPSFIFLEQNEGLLEFQKLDYEKLLSNFVTQWIQRIENQGNLNKSISLVIEQLLIKMCKRIYLHLSVEEQFHVLSLKEETTTELIAFCKNMPLSVKDDTLFWMILALQINCLRYFIMSDDELSMCVLVDDTVEYSLINRALLLKKKEKETKYVDQIFKYLYKFIEKKSSLSVELYLSYFQLMMESSSCPKSKASIVNLMINSAKKTKSLHFYKALIRKFASSLKEDVIFPLAIKIFIQSKENVVSNGFGEQIKQAFDIFIKVIKSTKEDLYFQPTPDEIAVFQKYKSFAIAEHKSLLTSKLQNVYKSVIELIRIDEDAFNEYCCFLIKLHSDQDKENSPKTQKNNSKSDLLRQIGEYYLSGTYKSPKTAQMLYYVASLFYKSKDYSLICNLIKESVNIELRQLANLDHEIVKKRLVMIMATTSETKAYKGRTRYTDDLSIDGYLCILEIFQNYFQAVEEPIVAGDFVDHLIYLSSRMKQIEPLSLKFPKDNQKLIVRLEAESLAKYKISSTSLENYYKSYSNEMKEALVELLIVKLYNGNLQGVVEEAQSLLSKEAPYLWKVYLILVIVNFLNNQTVKVDFLDNAIIEYNKAKVAASKPILFTDDSLILKWTVDFCNLVRDYSRQLVFLSIMEDLGFANEKLLNQKLICYINLGLLNQAKSFLLSKCKVTNNEDAVTQFTMNYLNQKSKLTYHLDVDDGDLKDKVSSLFYNSILGFRRGQLVHSLYFALECLKLIKGLKKRIDETSKKISNWSLIAIYYSLIEHLTFLYCIRGSLLEAKYYKESFEQLGSMISSSSIHFASISLSSHLLLRQMNSDDLALLNTSKDFEISFDNFESYCSFLNIALNTLEIASDTEKSKMIQDIELNLLDIHKIKRSQDLDLSESSKFMSLKFRLSQIKFCLTGDKKEVEKPLKDAPAELDLEKATLVFLLFQRSFYFKDYADDSIITVDNIKKLSKAKLDSFGKLEEAFNVLLGKGSQDIVQRCGILLAHYLMASGSDKAAFYLESSKNISVVREQEFLNFEQASSVQFNPIQSQLEIATCFTNQKYLPYQYSILSISIDETSNRIIINRISEDHPLIVSINFKRQFNVTEFTSFSMILDEFNRIIKESESSTSRLNPTDHISQKDKRIWWEQRRDLDSQLQSLLESIENACLGGFKGILNRVTSSQSIGTSELVKVLESHFLKKKGPGSAIALDEEIGYLLIELISDLNPDTNQLIIEVLQYAYSCMALKMKNQLKDWDSIKLDKLVNEIREAINSNIDDDTHDFHIFLILDRKAQLLPWESIPIFRGKSVSRLPTLPMLQERLTKTFYSDANNAYYILNPSHDLVNTQKEFEQLLLSNHNWEGVINQAPTKIQFEKALSQSDIFLYFGHSSGGKAIFMAFINLLEQYYSSQNVKQLTKCATSILMGCSSGLLKQIGDFGPLGSALSYLFAKSPCVVANLWDVTDKDIDRFTKSLLDKWLLTNESNIHLCTAVATSRDACQLPYLIGASPVCYGVPVYIKRTSLK